MGEVTMFNPTNHAVIITTADYIQKWNRMGFVVVHNIIPYRLKELRREVSYA